MNNVRRWQMDKCVCVGTSIHRWGREEGGENEKTCKNIAVYEKVKQKVVPISQGLFDVTFNSSRQFSGGCGVQPANCGGGLAIGEYEIRLNCSVFRNIYNTCLSCILFLLFGGFERVSRTDRLARYLVDYLFLPQIYTYFSIQCRYYRVLFCCTVVVFYSILGILNFIVFVVCLLAGKTSFKNSGNVFGRRNAVDEYGI